MLTPEEREKLTAVLSDMKPEARIKHIAALRQKGGRAAEVSVLEGIHRQLCFAENAAKFPLEIDGIPKREKQVQVSVSQPGEIYWNQRRVAYAVGAVSVTGAMAYISAVIIIPAIVAVVSAIVSAVAVAAPYVAGALLGFFVIRESFFAQKKTENYQPPASGTGGNTYNVYIGNDQNVRVFGGGQNPGQ